MDKTFAAWPPTILLTGAAVCSWFTLPHLQQAFDILHVHTFEPDFTPPELDEMMEDLSESSVVLVFLDSFNKGYIDSEHLRLAILSGKIIIPVLHDGGSVAHLPAELRKHLEPSLDFAGQHDSEFASRVYQALERFHASCAV